MSQQLETNVLVLGGGPGGYVAAIRCGQLGLDTILVEGERLGGACLIRGCIPSKALIHAAEEYAAVSRASRAGHPLGIRLTGGKLALDFAKTIAWKDGIVDKLSGGVGALLRRAKVKVVAGWGTFTDPNTCSVKRADGATVSIKARHVILAAGSEAQALPNLPWGGDILSSTEALSLQAVPKRLAVVGAGYIGMELGMAFRRLGSQVTIVEALDRILPQFDETLSDPVMRACGREGVEIRLGAKASGFSDGALQIETGGGAAERIEADKVLVTVGRRPRTAGWGLETLRLEMAGAFVKVDAQCRSSAANVWAIGDLVGEPMLAHKASAQGEMVAEIIAGRKRQFDPLAIPAVCFTHPEIVTAGVADASGEGLISAEFPLAANGRALSMEAGKDGGFVRVIARKDDHRIVGLAAVGRQVSELSSQMVTLVEMGALLEDVAGMIHAHPTQSEALHEASLRLLGHAIHI